MQCKNHPAESAAARCDGCAEPFCANCLVEVQGQHYCGSCKVLAVQGRPAPQFGRTARTCQTAKEALTFAIIGNVVCLICCLAAIIHRYRR